MSTSDTATVRTGIIQAVNDYVSAMLAHPEAFRGQQVRGGGPVAEFEILLAQKTGFHYCLATSNATSALLVAALALDLAGKKIAVESEAWEGSLGAIEAAGAEIIEVESLLTAPLGEVAVVLATDRPGHRHDASGVRERCDRAGIKYIEDTGWLPGITAPAAQLSLADVQVISFGPGKPMSLGEGGALLCRDKPLYEHAIAISQHPERAIAEGIEILGRQPLNARIHPLAAVIGCQIFRAEGISHLQSLET